MKKVVSVFMLVCCLLSCEEIAFVPDISESNVVIIAPSENAALEGSPIRFTWEAVADADGHRVQIVRPDFENAEQLVLDSLVTGTVITQALAAGAYQWRVRAENSGFNTPYTVSGFSVAETNTGVITPDLSEAQIVVLTPEDEATLNTGTPVTLSWNAVLDAETYTVEIATPNFENNATPIESQTITETSLVLMDLEAGMYQWRVKALNATAETESMFFTQRFTIQ
jgi:uncharacterized protein YegP (UPF0339 family)